jgi:NAD-dependent dihydropyrimidine dehydrogenase PreA subunit
MSNTDEVVNIFAKSLTIHENTPVDQLKDLDNSIVMYSKNDLTEELVEIIRIYNMIPQVRNKKSNHVKIIFEYDGKTIYLVIDPNDSEVCDYKKIMELCAQYELEFKNESFSQLINQLKTKHFDKSVKRHVFTKAERDAIYCTQKECNLCKAKVTKGKFHLDHIVALANGGNNDLKNIQVLCIPCHFQKTKHETEEGYVHMVATESSFNSTVK